MTDNLKSYERYEPRKEKPYLFRVCKCGHLSSNHNITTWKAVLSIGWCYGCDKCMCNGFWTKYKVPYEEIPK